MSTKVTALPGEHVLRLGTILTFVPGLVLLSVAGAIERIVLLLVTLLPLSFSLISSLAHLYLKRVQKRNHGLDDAPSSIALGFRSFCGSWLHPVSDLFFACTYLGILTAFWTMSDSDGWCGYRRCHYRDSSRIMLLAYSTVPPVVNMLIHFYFGIVGTIVWARTCRSGKQMPKCANCGHTQGPLIHRVAPVIRAHKADGATYSLLGDRNYGYLGEDIPRASMESGPSAPRSSEETAVDKV